MRSYGLLILLLASVGCRAQNDSLNNQVSVGAQFLTHGEACGGGLPKSDDGTAATEDRSCFLYGRLRLNADYERTGLKAHVTIQNSAVWGMSGNQALKLYEGWVKMTAKNGDQVYAGSYYDNGAQLYKTMHNVWYHYDVPKFPLGASLLFMNIGQQAGIQGDPYNSPSTEYQQMYGGYINFHPKYLSLEGSYYRQTGKVVNDAKFAVPIKAWMVGAKATVKPSDQYGFLVGYDYLSGDDYVPVVYGGTVGLPYHATEGGFTPMYGSRTKFYGMMDYFYESAYTQGFTPGLQNAFVGVFGKPTAKLDCKAAYHYLAVATTLSGLDRTLGHSIELEASYQFSKDIALVAGYTQMIGTETMDRLKQGSASKQARWGWFSLVVSPSILTTKW